MPAPNLLQPPTASPASPSTINLLAAWLAQKWQQAKGAVDIAPDLKRMDTYNPITYVVRGTGGNPNGLAPDPTVSAIVGDFLGQNLKKSTQNIKDTWGDIKRSISK